MSNLGTIRGQMVLDVKQALNAYTSARQAHVSTVTALSTGAGALTTAGASIAAAGVAMGAGFLHAVNAAAEFERKLDYFVAVGGPGAADQYDAVRDKALQLGADTIYSADQIADAFVELAKSGVGAQDIINGIGEGVAALGAAADIPLDTAANIITAAVATFGLGAEKAVYVADQLAGAANASIIDVQDLGVSLKYAGGVASSLGVPFGDLNAALAILGVNGIKGSTAGTSLRQVLLGLNGTTNKAQEALKSLGIITEDGANKFYTAEGKAKSLAEVFQILQDATAGMSDQQRTATMQQIFATRALPSLIALTKAGADGFAEMSAEIAKTTAFDVASARLDNLSGDLEILRGNLDTLAITMGSRVQGPARSLIQTITDLIQTFLDMDEKAQDFIIWLLGIGSAVLITIGILGMLSGAILNIIGLAIRLAPVFNFLGGAVAALMTPFALLFALLLRNPLKSLFGIIGLVAGALTYFFTQTETGQAIWSRFMEVVGKAVDVLGPILLQLATTVGTWLAEAFEKLGPHLSKLAESLGGFFLDALEAVLPVLEAVGNFLLAVLAPVLPIVSQLVDALADSFSGVKTDAKGMEGVIDIVVGILAGIAQAIPHIITAIIQLVTLILQALVAALPLIITGAIKLFTGIIKAITQVLPQIIQGIVMLVTMVVQAIVAAAPMLIKGAITFFTGIIQAIVQVLPLIIQGLTQLILALVQIITTMIPMFIQAAIQLFMALVQAVPKVLPPLIQAIVGILPALTGALLSMLPMLIEAALQLFMALVQVIPQIIPPLIQAIVSLTPVIVGSVVSLLPMLFDAAIQLFNALVNAIPAVLPDIIKAIVDTLPAIVSALIGMIPVLFEAAIQLFMAIVMAIPEIIGALVAAMWDLGAQMIQGLIDGIISLATSVADAVANVVQGSIDTANGVLDINSPSRVFFDIGKWTFQGMVNGLKVMKPKVLDQVDQMATAMIDFYDQVGAARQLENDIALSARVGVEMSSSVAAQMAKLTQQMAAIADKDTINIEKMEVNNPEPETSSESFPNSIRKATYLVG